MDVEYGKDERAGNAMTPEGAAERGTAAPVRTLTRRMIRKSLGRPRHGLVPGKWPRFRAAVRRRATALAGLQLRLGLAGCLVCLLAFLAMERLDVVGLIVLAVGLLICLVVAAVSFVFAWCGVSVESQGFDLFDLKAWRRPGVTAPAIQYDTTGITVGDVAPVRIDWWQLLALDEQGDQLLVRWTEGEFRLDPRAAGGRRLVKTIRMVLDARERGFRLPDEPVPDGAISQVRLNAEDDATRGLSQAAEPNAEQLA